MDTIKLGDLALDAAEFASQGSAVLGIRDSGKTYTATLIAERMFDAGIPFVAFDPIGVWRFLRVPGKGKGYPVVVAGGEEGDLPLSPTSAPAIVEAAMQNGVSLVLDLFDMRLSKADWKRIVRDCVTLLLHKNKEHGLRHIFLEEAAEFAPQKVSGTSGEVYAVVEKLARMGGNSRLGYTLINQRSQEVNKAVLELCDNLFLHRQKGLNSLANLKKWLDVAGADGAAVMSSLPTLPQGECWAWISGSDTPEHLHVPAKNSLHPDRRVTREAASAAEALRSAIPVDSFLEKLRAQLAEIEDEAKTNDPAALRRQITALKGEVKRLEGEKVAVERARDVYAAKLDEKKAADGPTWGDGYTAGFEACREAVQAAIAKLSHGGKVPRSGAKPLGDVIAEGERSRAHVRPAVESPPFKMDREPGALPGPQQKILNALRWWEAFGIAQPTNEQVAFIAGYSPRSTGYTNPRGAAKSAGLIDYPAPGTVALTGHGLGLALETEKPRTVQALHQAVLEKLPGPQQRILGPLLESYPGGMSNEALATAAGYSHSSTGYTNPRGAMKSLGLVTYPASGHVRAADWLFPKGKK